MYDNNLHQKIASRGLAPVGDEYLQRYDRLTPRESITDWKARYDRMTPEEKEASYTETWPEGRDLFYEGDDPEGFKRDMKKLGCRTWITEPYVFTEEDAKLGQGMVAGEMLYEGGELMVHVPPGLLYAVQSRYPLGS